MKIAVDCDGVLSDFVGQVLLLLSNKFGMEFHREDVTDFSFTYIRSHLEKRSLDLYNEIDKSVKKTGFCERMKVIEGSQELFKVLGWIGKVSVVTKPFNINWFSQRAWWLKEHFDLDVKNNLVFMSEKADLFPSYDFLIEDNPENARKFIERGGKAFLIAHTYNKDCGDIPRGSYDECIEYVSKESKAVSQ